MDFFGQIGNYFNNLFGGGQQPKRITPSGPALNWNQAVSSGGLSNIHTPSVLGASTGPVYGPQQPYGPAVPSGGGGGGSNTGALDQIFGQQQQDTRNQYNDQLNSARNLYDQRAGLLRNQLGDLGNQRDSLLNQIGSNYGGVIQQAKDTLQQNLGALNKAKGDVTTGYENQKLQQAQLLGDQRRQNREMARALGDLGSSFYENLQSKAQANTNQNITNIGDQEQSQLDTIGQQIITQNTDAGTKIDQLNQQEAQAKQQILNQYQSAYNNIQSELGFNSKDSVNALQSINDQMQSTLDNISQTMAQYKLAAQQSGRVTNPISNISAYAKNLATLQSVTQPIQDQQIMQQAIQALQSDPSQFQNIVGQLQLYDAQNGTKLADQIGGLQPKQTGTTGGFFGFGGTPVYNVPGGQGPLKLPTQPSYLDQLISNLGQ